MEPTITIILTSAVDIFEIVAIVIVAALALVIAADFFCCARI